MTFHIYIERLIYGEWLKGLRLMMWSLLHDTDQLREMLSTDQSNTFVLGLC